MLRIILKRERMLGEPTWLELKDVQTFDVDLPEVEAALRRGRLAEMSYDVTSVVGIEVLDSKGSVL